MFKIKKSFDFCYGHRVFSQDVVEKYSLSTECPCHRIHGHQGQASVFVETEQLDSRGFVIDFKELNFMKKFIDNNIDHRFIISVQDPEFERLVGLSVEQAQEKSTPIYLLGNEVEMGQRIIDESDRHLDSFFIVDFNPTSEELSKWLFSKVDLLIKESPFDCKVQKVIWSETPKTGAEYSNED